MLRSPTWISLRKAGNMATNNELETVLKSLARLCALEAGISLPCINLDDGRPLGCSDVHMLSITSMGKSASVKISREEMAGYHKPDGLVRADRVVKKAVNRLLERLKED